MINYGNYRQSNNDFQSNSINENVFCIHNNQSSICSSVFKLAAIYTHANHYYDSFDKTCLFSVQLHIIYFCIPISISLWKYPKDSEDCPLFSLPETLQDINSLSWLPRVSADSVSYCMMDCWEEPTPERSISESPVYTLL